MLKICRKLNYRGTAILKNFNSGNMLIFIKVFLLFPFHNENSRICPNFTTPEFMQKTMVVSLELSLYNLADYGVYLLVKFIKFSFCERKSFSFHETK